MGKIIMLLFLGTVYVANAQQFTLKKGTVIDSIVVRDSVSESFSLFLPTSFDLDKNWPIVFVFDMKGKGKQAIRMYMDAAEDQGYILAASNNVNDSLSTSQNILVTGRMFNTVVKLLPVHRNRTYTSGLGEGARFASMLPLFIKGITGVISCGSAYPNYEVLDAKQSFYWIGLVGKEDHAYTAMLEGKLVFDKLKIPNNLIVFEGGHEWPNTNYLKKAMEIFTLSAMAKGDVERDERYIDRSYDNNLTALHGLLNSNKLLQADNLLDVSLSVYRLHKETDSLKNLKKQLKKNKTFKAMQRDENNTMLKESFIKEDYLYALEEDVATYNFNNLGWWVYQMGELNKYEKSKSVAEQQMGKRILEFLNAVIEEDIALLGAEKKIDREALGLLWMLKTITAPKEYGNYLKIISNSAKEGDFGTALFYLEELLKNGYTDKVQLYRLDHTALLRITPEFNRIVEKYLKNARYEVIVD
ncbi:MAG TPA: hypothetical protein VLZ54_02735 [Arenibacter sp.]|nr:hypothetical protein [Arenibacter sp.]